jgi:predicted metalloendopeptidase
MPRATGSKTIRFRRQKCAGGLFQRAGRPQQRHSAQPFSNESARNASKAAKGTNAQKVGDYYATAMDSAAIERCRPEAPQALPRPHCRASRTWRACRNLWPTPKPTTGNSWFGAGVGQDDKISTQYSVQMGQGGISTLPDRDYYLKEDGRSKAIRTLTRPIWLTRVQAARRQRGDRPRPTPLR